MSTGRNDRVGGSLLRRVLPAEAVILMALGYLRWLGEKHGLYRGT